MIRPLIRAHKYRSRISWKRSQTLLSKFYTNLRRWPLSLLRRVLQGIPLCRPSSLTFISKYYQGRPNLYCSNSNDIERIKNINDLIKDKLPALLASTQGLYVACACFTMLDAKDRKGVLKTLKEDIKEMFTNKMAHLFLIHILSTLDDTTLSKKKIITVSRDSDLNLIV